MDREKTEGLLSALEYINVGQEKITALLTDDRKKEKDALEYLNLIQGTGQKLKKHLAKDEARSRCVPHNTGRSVRVSPCEAAILEGERQQREREEKEIRKRPKRERKEIVRREQELQTREPYMCPGQVQMEKAALMDAKREHLAAKHLKLDDSNANSYRVLCQSVQNYAPRDSRLCPATPVGAIPLKKVKSPELRGGIIYSNCDCIKKNGLQDDCRLIPCMENPECLTIPPK
jgi:hypothetical protein